MKYGVEKEEDKTVNSKRFLSFKDILTAQIFLVYTIIKNFIILIVP